MEINEIEKHFIENWDTIDEFKKYVNGFIVENSDRAYTLHNVPINMLYIINNYSEIMDAYYVYHSTKSRIVYINKLFSFQVSLKIVNSDNAFIYLQDTSNSYYYTCFPVITRLRRRVIPEYPYPQCMYLEFPDFTKDLEIIKLLKNSTNSMLGLSFTDDFITGIKHMKLENEFIEFCSELWPDLADWYKLLLEIS